MSKGIAITVGVTSVDPTQYGQNDQTKEQCACCANDADSLQGLAKPQGFDVDQWTFRDESAVAEDVLQAIARAGDALGDRDYLLVYFSCHGGNISTPHGEVEALALYNRPLLNEELAEAWRNLKNEVRVFVIIDACESGALGGMPFRKRKQSELAHAHVHANVRPHAPAFIDLFSTDPCEDKLRTTPLGLVNKIIRADGTKLYEKHKEVYERVFKRLANEHVTQPPAAVAILSACSACEAANGCDGGEAHSLFTAALLDVWDDDQDEITNYDSFTSLIADQLDGRQTPVLRVQAPNDPEFRTLKPFDLSR